MRRYRSTSLFGSSTPFDLFPLIALMHRSALARPILRSPNRNRFPWPTRNSLPCVITTKLRPQRSSSSAILQEHWPPDGFATERRLAEWVGA